MHLCDEKRFTNSLRSDSWGVGECGAGWERWGAVFFGSHYSTKQRLDSLSSHHGAVQFFFVWLCRSDSRWEQSCGSFAKCSLNVLHTMIVGPVYAIFFYIILFSLSTFWGSKLEINAGIEIPKYVDTVTPQYKPKFDAVVSSCCSHTFVFLSLLPENLFCFLCFLSWVALPTFPRWVHPIFLVPVLTPYLIADVVLFGSYIYVTCRLLN